MPQNSKAENIFNLLEMIASGLYVINIAETLITSVNLMLNKIVNQDYGYETFDDICVIQWKNKTFVYYYICCKNNSDYKKLHDLFDESFELFKVIKERHGNVEKLWDRINKLHSKS